MGLRIQDMIAGSKYEWSSFVACGRSPQDRLSTISARRSTQMLQTPLSDKLCHDLPDLDSKPSFGPSVRSVALALRGRNLFRNAMTPIKTQ